jgi:hypothetical protein
MTITETLFKCDSAKAGGRGRWKTANGKEGVKRKEKGGEETYFIESKDNKDKKQETKYHR